jgi:hypothetical protein
MRVTAIVAYHSSGPRWASKRQPRAQSVQIWESRWWSRRLMRGES